MNLYLSLLNKINKQKIHPPIIVFSDLDDTYLLKYWPSEEILKKEPQRKTDVLLFNDKKKYINTYKLKKILNNLSIPLIIISGRDYYQIMDYKNHFSKKYPEIKEVMNFDGIISAIGTEIFLKIKNRYVKDYDYNKLIEKNFFNRKIIKEKINNFISFLKKKNKNYFQYCSLSKRDLENNPKELPPVKNKISLEFITSFNKAQKFLSKLKKYFITNNFKNLQLMLSSPYKISKLYYKFNLDITPVSKDFAVKYLIDKLKGQKPELKTIVCGDSGNDFEMLYQTGDYKIIPGNAKRELIEKINILNNNKSNFFIYKKKFIGPLAIIDFIKKYEDING